MVKVGILGSRELACKITKWIINTGSVNIVGAVPPPFKGWWDDNYRNILVENGIKVFDEVEQLIKEKPDIVFSINYWKTISGENIKEVPLGIVNIHHSYLLKYKGRYSTSWAIMNARKLNCWEHGSTLHLIDEKLDEGKIIDSWKCEITENDTAETLFKKVEQLSIEMFKANFQRIINRNTQFLNPDSNSFFYGKESNNIEIPNNSSIEEIYDYVRAWTFKDRPKPFFSFKGKKIRVYIDDDSEGK